MEILKNSVILVLMGEDCYPKVFVSYFVINILSGFKGCSEEEIYGDAGLI